MKYLYCRKCGSTASAYSGDYFMARPEYVFKCCKVQMWLCEKRGRFEGDLILAHKITVGAL